MTDERIILTSQNAEGLTDVQEGLAVSIHNAGAIKFDFNEGFLLKSGQRSPIYIDLRVIQSFPDAREATTRALAEQADGLVFDRVVGIPRAGDPFATLVADRLRKPQITLRPESKNHGIARTIDGNFNFGEKILVIDDLVTTGGSKLEAIDLLTENGLKVGDVIVVFDRQQGGERQLAERGLVLHTALKLRPILKFYERTGKMTHEEFIKVIDYLDKNG